MRGPAPIADRHRGVARDVLHLLVRDPVGLVGERRGRIDVLDGRRCHAALHAHGIADGIEPGAQLHQARRAVLIVLQILLARPEELDRHAAQRPRDAHRLPDIILRQSPTECAARLHAVHVHVGRRHGCGLRRGRVRGFGVLRRGPDIDLPVLDERGASRGLERGMGEKRRVVLELEHALGLGDRRFRLALPLDHRCRRVGLEPLAEVALDALAGDALVAPAVPDDRQRAPALARRATSCPRPRRRSLRTRSTRSTPGRLRTAASSTEPTRPPTTGLCATAACTIPGSCMSTA